MLKLANCERDHLSGQPLLCFAKYYILTCLSLKAYSVTCYCSKSLPSDIHGPFGCWLLAAHPFKKAILKDKRCTSL